MSSEMNEYELPLMYRGVHCTEAEYKELCNLENGNLLNTLEVETYLTKLRRTTTKPVEPTTLSIEATLAQRGKRYGDFSDHARLCQNLVGQLQHFEVPASDQEQFKEGDKIHITPWHNLDPVKRQALTVICDKLARILSGDPNYDDNWVDICGYATLVLQRLPKETN